MGIVVFYVTHIPGPMAVEIPAFLFVLAVVRRTAGIGSLAPLRSVLRSTWILLRMVVELLTDIEWDVDGWFWAFALSVSWPLFTAMRYGVQCWAKHPAGGASDNERSEECERPRNPTTPPNRSCATANTASESTPSKRSERAHTGSEFQAEGVYRKKRSYQPLAARMRNSGNAVWCRMAENDARRHEMWKTNPLDGCEWIRLCSMRKERYADRAVAQQCATRGCSKTRSGEVAKGTLSKMRPDHEMGTCPQPESDKEEVGETQEQFIPTSKGGGQKPNRIDALNRVTKLQKRANVRQKTPRTKKSPE